jgi:hypothetical protein
LIFRNAAGTILGQTDMAVTQNVDANFGQLAFYSITATAPAGTTKARVQSFITCDYVKMDAFCLRVNTNGLRSNQAVTPTTDEYVTTVEPSPIAKTIVKDADMPVFDVVVTPNPFIDFVDIYTKAKDNITPVEMRVMNTNGKIMYVQKTAANNKQKINTATWMTGIYLVEVIQGKERKVIKLVKL